MGFFLSQILYLYGAEEFYNLALDPNETTNLLNGNLTATDISNYHFLCDSITALTGVGTCKPLAVNSIRQLMNQMGQIIYSGNEIEKQDFSSLPNGIYYLKINNESIKLIK